MPNRPTIPARTDDAGHSASSNRRFETTSSRLLYAYRQRANAYACLIFILFITVYTLVSIKIPEPWKTPLSNLIASLFAAIFVWILVDRTLTSFHLTDIENRFLGALHSPSIIPTLYTDDEKQRIAGSSLSTIMGNNVNLGHTIARSLRHSCDQPDKDICYNLNWRIDIEIDNDDYFIVSGKVDYKRRLSENILKFRCISAPIWRRDREILSKESEFTWIFLGRTEDAPLDEAKFELDFVNAGGKVFSEESPDKIANGDSTDLNKEISYQTGKFSARNDHDGLSVISFSFRVRQARRYGSLAISLARYTRDATFTINMGTMPVKGVYYYPHFPAENYPTPLSKSSDQKVIQIKLAGWVLKGGGIVYSWQE